MFYRIFYATVGLSFTHTSSFLNKNMHTFASHAYPQQQKAIKNLSDYEQQKITDDSRSTSSSYC